MSAHGLSNWSQICQSFTSRPSHRQEKSCVYHQISHLTASFSYHLFQATPSGPAVLSVVYLTTSLQAYREPGMLNLEYLYWIFTLATNYRQDCYHQVSSALQPTHNFLMSSISAKMTEMITSLVCLQWVLQVRHWTKMIV